MAPTGDFLKTILSVLATVVAPNQKHILNAETESSVCIKTISVGEPFSQPYYENYWSYENCAWIMRTRYNPRFGHRMVEKEIKECCDGYQEINRDQDGNPTCHPVCTPDCLNGRCAKPNECTCDNGFQKIPGSQQCEAVCDKPCSNGRCVAPNQCECNSGYAHTTNDHDCQPVCTIGCPENSDCTEPNRCTCHGGYKKTIEQNGSIHCRPICRKECANGKCVAPNACKCNKGFKPRASDKYTCVPICEGGCPHGICTEPNVCTCNDGYRQNAEKVCEPVCEGGCPFGICTGPNVCTCNDGYSLNAQNDCEPVCSKACVHGSCAAPNICKCNFGWIRDNCEEAAFCLVTLELNDTNTDRIVPKTETNGTTITLNAMDDLARCPECADFLNSSSLCYTLQKPDDLPSISCFISTEISCLETLHPITANLLDPLPVTSYMCAILLGLLAITGAFLVFRKKRIQPVVPMQTSGQMESGLYLEAAS